jgi:hypothetical protein
MRMSRNINWFGLAAGALVLIVMGVSFYMPWWELTIGQSLMKVNASPVNTNLGAFGSQFNIPLIWALNLIGILTFAVSGVVLLVYSLIPAKPYSSQLLSFSYKKPLYILISFIAGLLVLTSIAGFLGFGIPLQGSSNFSLPTQFMPMGLSVSTTVSASLQLPFWLGIAAVGLCIATRLYHGRAARLPEMAMKTQV